MLSELLHGIHEQPHQQRTTHTNFRKVF